MSQAAKRDHGGSVDAAVTRFGGQRDDWLDLSTGINPRAYPLPEFSARDWGALPDRSLEAAVLDAARQFWNVPRGAAIVAAPGASALIARLPLVAGKATVRIDTPTYNEHAGAFVQAGWTLAEDPAAARVIVHPNNPDGRLWDGLDTGAVTRDLLVIDESFCDVCPARSHIAKAAEDGVIVLKSFGKFWGLAGLRLGFAIGHPDVVAQLRAMLGPWPVSGPALRVGATALADSNWAEQTRAQLAQDVARLDAMVTASGLLCLGGTDLFRLYEAKSAQAAQDHLARHHIWTRIFPYSERWLRLGLPGHEAGWTQLQSALATLP